MKMLAKYLTTQPSYELRQSSYLAIKSNAYMYCTSTAESEIQ